MGVYTLENSAVTGYPKKLMDFAEGEKEKVRAASSYREETNQFSNILPAPPVAEW